MGDGYCLEDNLKAKAKSLVFQDWSLFEMLAFLIKENHGDDVLKNVTVNIITSTVLWLENQLACFSKCCLTLVSTGNISIQF